MNGQPAKVDLITVNWNSGDLLKNLVESLESVSDHKLIGKLIIIDNNSTDDSLNAVRQNLSFLIEIIRNEYNAGFASACNMGAKASTSQYLLFLNPDTRVYEGALSDSISFLENPSNQKYAACGIQLVNHLNIPNRSCARIPTFKNFLFSGVGLDILAPKTFPGVLLREWEHSSTTDIGHVIGAFYLVRRELFQQFGGFDERYFLYYEDLDFSTTLSKNGYKIAYLSDVRAVHVGGGCSQKIKARRLSYSYLSKLRYIKKHFPIYKSIPLLAVVLILEPIMRFAFYILQFSPKDAFISAAGYLRFVGTSLGNILRGGARARH